MGDAARSFGTKKPSSPSQNVFPKKSGLGSWTIIQQYKENIVITFIGNGLIIRIWLIYGLDSSFRHIVGNVSQCGPGQSGLG